MQSDVLTPGMEKLKDGSNTNVADFRAKYSTKALEDSDVPSNPHSLFKEWMEDAVKKLGMMEPNAMCLSTCGEDMKPKARFMLLKAYDEKGFVWFGNYDSRKSEQLLQNPNAVITFWWG
jgi:pyridoxamine 5'-phosphate oxidase